DLLRLRAALGFGLRLPAAVIVQQLILGNAAQPAAKGVPRTVEAKLVQTRDDGAEDLLLNIVGVLRAQTLAAAPVADQGAVQVKQAVPGFLIAAAQPIQQAERGRILQGGHETPCDAARIPVTLP